MLIFYNTLTKKKQEFKPIKSGLVNMYTCGPTVYSYAHIGNLRAYFFMDMLRRVLKFNNFKLNGVMNITDVGHLTSDADEGEDKMITASKKEHKSPYEIAEYYTKFFLKNIKELNIEEPEHIVKATNCIDDMIEFIGGLLKNGVAYNVGGNIYFDVSKIADYGRLSGIGLDDKRAGARIEINPEKRSPYDFALWIKAPENHIMKWASPWGLGYPGWHIECSTMSRKFLGDTFDIHTGGVDHITVHHENELAQSEGLTGKLQANYWMHVEFLQVDGGKMSKSLNNFYRLEDLQKLGYAPLDYRYFCLNGHYRKKLNFTFDALQSAKVARERLTEQVLLHKEGKNKVLKEDIEIYSNKFVDAINDDLNIPLALGVMWSMIKDLPYSHSVYAEILIMDEIFGLGLNEIKDVKSTLKIDVPQDVLDLATLRWQLKIAKKFGEADALRKQIFEMGYELIDTKDCYEVHKI
jgi:cysteinyl-tRNA synthetase